MAVQLLRPYGGFATNAIVAFPDSTETALIAQGLAVASTTTSIPSIVGAPFEPMTQGGNTYPVAQGGVQMSSAYTSSPTTWPCIPMGANALTGFETNGTVAVAGTIYMTEIYVPFWQTWTGAAVLNGTTVGTDKYIVALYGTNGALLANSAVAGATSAGASTFQKIAFTSAITLAPGRYFIAVQANGTTDTLRHLLSANGATNCTSSTAGVFGTIPSTMTIPSTFTTAVGVISELYV